MKKLLVLLAIIVLSNLNAQEYRFGLYFSHFPSKVAKVNLSLHNLDKGIWGVRTSWLGKMAMKGAKYIDLSYKKKGECSKNVYCDDISDIIKIFKKLPFQEDTRKFKFKKRDITMTRIENRYNFKSNKYEGYVQLAEINGDLDITEFYYDRGGSKFYKLKLLYDN